MIQSQTLDHLSLVANQFKPQGNIVAIAQHGNGNINHTFLITLEGTTEKNFILQRLNTRVFAQPELVMNNICFFCDHVRQRLSKINAPTSARQWQIPRVLLTSESKNYWIEDNQFFWRAMSFIDCSQCFDTIQDLNHAREIGYGLGMFHNLVSDLPSERLSDTLVGFHITPLYLQHYDRVLAQTKLSRSAEVNYCQQFIRDRTSLAYVLENAKAEGKLKLRVIHGDPKINNIMLDCTTGKAISMIDLDTVKPGLIHYDIGDCLRSGCNLLGEETLDWERVNFEPELAEAILQGYLSVARDFLTDNDYEYIYDAIRLLAFELGLRFFTDYLQNNIYFKANYPEHNLNRALVQFKLTESIEAQATLIQEIIEDVRG